MSLFCVPLSRLASSESEKGEKREKLTDLLLGNTLLQQIEEFRVVHSPREEGRRVSSVGGGRSRHVDRRSLVRVVAKGEEVEAGWQGGEGRRGWRGGERRPTNEL